MYIFEISDIMFLVKSLKFPSTNFNINNYISFSTSSTRSSGTKLIHNISFTNQHRNYYFVRICRLWNALPIIDLNLSMHTIKKHLQIFMWNHFSNHFDSTNTHTFHFICPCSSCLNSPPSTNFSYLTNHL